MTWLVINKQYGDGTAPSVAINDAGLIVEVHQGEDDALMYGTGIMDPHSGRSANIAERGQYGVGAAPSVAMNDGGMFIEVHESTANSALCQDVAQLTNDGGTVTWLTQNYSFDLGQSPVVTLGSSSKVGMDVHQAQSSDYLRLNPRIVWW